MRFSINSKGVVAAIGAPRAVAEKMRHWFGAKLSNGLVLIPHRKVWAAISHYPAATVDNALRDWLDRQFSPHALWNRISPHLKTYRGGYQAKIAVKALGDRRHGVWSSYGSGKTVIACELAWQTGPTLLVTPPNIWDNAYVLREPAEDGKPQGDLLRFYRKKLRWVEIMGHRVRDTRMSNLRNPADVYAVSAYLFKSLLPELLDVPFSTIILDDVIGIRNSDSQFMRALAELKHKATFRYDLRADPSPEDLGDFWPVMNFLDDKLFPDQSDFESEYGQRGQWKVEYKDAKKNLSGLERIRDTGIVTLLPQERFWPEAKPPRVQKVMVRLQQAEQDAYNHMRDDLVYRAASGADAITASTEMERVMKLRELTAGFVYDGHKRPHSVVETPSKIRMLRRILTTAEPHGCHRQQAIIWCYFDHEFDRVCAELQSLKVSYGVLRGRDRASRDAMRDFSARRIQILVSHERSASHGLRFPRCHHAIWMSLNRSSGDFKQAIKRIHRPPQKHVVTIWLLTAPGTVDEDIVRCLEGKETWRSLVKKVLAKDLHAAPHAANHQDHAQ